jgi:hypothetical protein
LSANSEVSNDTNVLTLYENLLKHNSYLYHKAKKCHFASGSTVYEAEASTEAPQVRGLEKHFLAV